MFINYCCFFYSLWRKLLGSIQQRIGHNKVGIFGLLQVIADAVKLLTKEIILPMRANRAIFIFAALTTFFLSLLPWIVMPFGPSIVVSNMDFGILLILLVYSLNVYGIILSGWASNSRYSFIGALLKWYLTSWQWALL